MEHKHGKKLHYRPVWTVARRLLLLPLLCFLFTTGSWGQAIFLGTDAVTGAQCNCLDNATTLTDGQFTDTLTIVSGAGESWLVTNNNGAFSDSSPSPPQMPDAVTVGTMFDEISAGVYRLIIRHVDGQGFMLSANNGATTLNIDNICYYPDIAFMGLPDTICLTSNPVMLLGENNGIAGVGSFTINGQLATIFNAQTLGVGIYNVIYTFNAGTGTPDDPTDPACISVVSKEVVVPDQPNTAVTALVNVTLGMDCEAVITPEMIMTGEYPCMDDFIVTVFDQNGIDIGNTVNGTHAGERLNVQVMSEAGMFTGTGQIDIFDVDAPSITCPPGNSMPQIDNQVQLLNATIPNTAPSFVPGNFACYNDAVAPMSGPHFYQLQQINVNVTDVYTIELNMDAVGGGVFGLYQGSFNPFQGLCQGIVGVSEPLPIGEGYYTTVDEVTRLHVMLMPGMPYTLLTMGYEGSQLANYEYAFYSAGDGQVIGLDSVATSIKLPLYCSSVPGLINNEESVELLGAPVVNDACMLNPPVTFTDQFTNGGNCGVSTITRTFTVTDDSGNSDQCVQEIEFAPITLEEVNLPPKTVNIPCDESFVANEEGNPTPELTGFPFVITAGGAFNIDPVYCNVLSSYEDLPRVAVCTGTEQFVRRWTIFDDCGTSDLIQFDQLIVIGDRTGPIVSCPAPDTDMNGLPDTLVFGTQINCTGTLQVPLPNVSDNCGGWTVLTEVVTQIQVPILNPFGQIIGFETETSVFATVAFTGSRIVNNVPVGTHFFRFIATDDCGNSSQVECPFRIEDFALPTAVCDDLLHVSLGGDGIGAITAQDIDEGSSDNCGPVSLLLRRAIDFDPDDCSAIAPTFTAYAPDINLYCCEVGDTVMVQLLVTDVVGNANICMSQVVITDNTAPICLAPPPVSISCADMPADGNLEDTDLLEELFGSAQAIDACDGAITIEFSPQVNLQSCGLGNIIRYFEVSDLAGNTSTCQQFIDITTTNSYAIRFPQDVIGDCVEVGADTLAIENFGCGDFAVNSTDELFTVTNGACLKIMRTYSIINWCEYDGFSTPTIVPRNPGCREEPGMEDVWLIRNSDGTTFIDIDNDPTNNTPAFGTKSTDCDGTTNPAGYWQNIQGNGAWSYTQVIKVIDSSVPTIAAETLAPFCSSGSDCGGNATIDFSITDGCAASPPTINVAVALFNTGQFTTNANLTGTFPNYQATGNFPIGNHRLRIEADDPCGNTGVAFVDFSIVDCIAPGVSCTGSMTIGLMPQLPGIDADGDGDIDLAAVAVPAEMFINAVNETCSEPLRYTIHRIDQLDAGTDVPFPNHPALVVTCDEIGLLPVRIFVWDSAFNPSAVQPDGTVGGPNYTTCDALLLVQDNNNLCSTTGNVMGTISGLIITEEGVPVAGVEVSPREDMAYDMMMTESDGLYDFELATAEGYEIFPYSPEDYMNGVSTIDIIYIAKHILGVDLLDSPYKMIAADINHSNTITTLDLIHLRKAILNITTGFPDNTSWRYVDAGYNFPNPTDPWGEEFPETVTVPMLGNNIYGADFIAVKIGDINGNAQANADEQGGERAVGDTYYLRTEELEFDAGETIEAVFTVADVTDEVQGFQFTLQFDPEQIALADIEWSQIQPEHVNQELAERGIITISWDASRIPADLSQGEMTFFILRFDAQTAGRLSESIAITSHQLSAEAYGIDDSVRSLGLNFAPAEQTNEGFFLEQNRPNPFGDQTIIGFQIPDGGDVTLTIYDANGKIVMAHQQYYTAGYNQIMVAASEVSARGLLYYKLETGLYTATKKMIILN